MNELKALLEHIPGGVAVYRQENKQLRLVFGNTAFYRVMNNRHSEGDFLADVYPADLPELQAKVEQVMKEGGEISHTFRILSKEPDSCRWVHINGRTQCEKDGSALLYVSYTDITGEKQQTTEIANEAADAIYVINRETYEVLYFHESKKMFPGVEECIGKPCYKVLQGLDAPCPFCNFTNCISGEDCEIVSQWNKRTYQLRFQETVWNGTPAFIQYLRDITREVETRQEKKRLEQYFETLVESLPGGVVVVRCQSDGVFVPEFLSAGFAEMTGTTLERAWEMYSHDALSGVHPEDKSRIRRELHEAMEKPQRRYELVYRLENGTGEYIWVRNTLSMLPSEGGDMRQYCYLQDITKERREQEHTREQYAKLLVQHYREPGPNALIVGHCNISRNCILEINDYTGTGCIRNLGAERDDFFKGFSRMIVSKAERKKFLDLYLSGPLLEAYKRKETKHSISCLIRLPGETKGRYVQCKVNLVEDPDTGDVTGILTVTDITEQMVADQVLKRLSDTGYDHIIVLDLASDHYTVFTSDPKACCVPPQSGSHSKWMKKLETRILPKDREIYCKYLDVEYIENRLEKQGAYSFDYTLTDDEGNIRVKRMTVFPIDLRLGKVGLSRTDVTEPVREQQSLLNMLAYTFELAAFIDVSTQKMIMHTRQTVLEDLSPFVMEEYDSRIGSGMGEYNVAGQTMDEIHNRFQMATLLEELAKKPRGYDFVYAYQGKPGIRYKKINVLWGDRTHQTVCIVRADVTELLEEERKNKQELENALLLANQANQAKTAFLSSMSHDIRTPMNAIMGMTALASARPNDSAYVMDCLGKIATSSKHLLNLINDVLDMSKIEHASIELSRELISVRDMVQQVCTMIIPQAAEKKQEFKTRIGELVHENFYGDALRINQIFINILANAVKFTPEGGTVELEVEECEALAEDCVRYRICVRDTGIGMSPDVVERIFEPFARGAHSNRIEGTGLGLSITKGLIERMNGNILVESAEGKGSLFTVELEFEPACELPLSVSSTEYLEESPEQSGEFLNGRHFLIAEDNDINAEILKSLLEMYGATSVVEVDGARAVANYSAHACGSYDAILMDVQMPVMNGYEAARAVRSMAREDARTIPIIAMTANAFAEDVQAALEAGMNAHVAKPIDVEILKGTLSRLF